MVPRTKWGTKGEKMALLPPESTFLKIDKLDVGRRSFDRLTALKAGCTIMRPSPQALLSSNVEKRHSSVKK
jgi:hypothetical protein